MFGITREALTSYENLSLEGLYLFFIMLPRKGNNRKGNNRIIGIIEGNRWSLNKWPSIKVFQSILNIFSYDS